jgi:hypothetical protein
MKPAPPSCRSREGLSERKGSVVKTSRAQLACDQDHMIER